MTPLTSSRIQSALDDLVAGRVPAPDAVDDRILDAALALLDAHGANLPMNELAQRAGVSRATLFRRFGTKDEVLKRLTAREFVTVTTELITIASTTAPEHTLVDVLTRALQIGATHPLFERLARHEPHALAQLASQGSPTFFDIGREFIAGAVQQTRGEKRRTAATDRVADLLLHALFGYLAFRATPTDLTDPKATRRLIADAVAALS